MSRVAETAARNLQASLLLYPLSPEEKALLQQANEQVFRLREVSSSFDAGVA
jgi:hypothetical protein